MTNGKTNGHSHGFDPTKLDEILNNTHPLEVRNTPPRPISPAVEELAAKGDAARERREKLRKLIRRVVSRATPVGYEDDTIAVLEGEVERLRERRNERERKARAERVAAAEKKP
jgi:hypothetical protein